MTETLAQNIGAKADALAPLRHSVEMLRNGMSDAPDKFTATMRAILAKHGEGAVRVRDLKPSACPAVLAAVRESLPMHLAAIAPVFPVPKNKKAAKLNNWQKIATQDPAAIRKMSAANPGCNWGVVWNVIDVDTKDPKPGKARGTDTWAAHVAANSEPDTRKALTPSGGVHYYIINQLDNSISTVMGDGVDSKGAGKGYVVTPGSYVEANGKDIRVSGFYKWANDRPVNSVPWIAAKFTDAKPAATVNADTAPGYPTEPLFDAKTGAAMLATLKASDYADQQAWLDLGMSYHYATAGQGLHEFREWCDTDIGYTGNIDNFETRWKSWNRADKVKDEHTFFEAVWDAGGAALVAKIKNDFADDPISDADLTAGMGEPDPIYPEPTSAKDLAAKVFPKRVEIVEGLILDGIVQTIDGDGGVGKSTVLMQASVAVAAGKQIFDRETSQRPVWFITHEDDEQDLQPVMMAMAAELDVNLADLPLEVSSLLDFDIAIADIDDNGKVKLLAFYRYLDKMLATRRGSLIVLDCLADIAQMQEAGRLAPNAFFKTVMTGLCKRHGVSIIVLAHPSKAAMVSGAWYSGGTAYKTAVRHKLVMKLVDPKDIYGPRTLETLKKNWGAPSAPITLTWQRGIFILDRDDPKAAEKSKVVIARILELIDGGHKVARNNQADGWTPKTLAGDIVDAEGGKLVNTKDVSKIMLAAERRAALKYFEATKHGKAHYERGTCGRC